MVTQGDVNKQIANMRLIVEQELKGVTDDDWKRIYLTLAYKELQKCQAILLSNINYAVIK